MAPDRDTEHQEQFDHKRNSTRREDLTSQGTAHRDLIPQPPSAEPSEMPSESKFLSFSFYAPFHISIQFMLIIALSGQKDIPYVGIS
jgi:hypothetical protein